MSNNKQHILSNPFPGLRPFGLSESHYFFGRKGQSSKVLEQLLKNRFVAVNGASGSGKSSLIYCGVIPALFGGYLKTLSNQWNIITTRPGNSPVKNLAKALLKNEKKDNENISNPDITQALLNRSSRGIVDYFNNYAPSKGVNHLLIIDQFEELFRYKETRSEEVQKEETETFIKLLVTAIQETNLPIYTIITIRSDFIGE